MCSAQQGRCSTTVSQQLLRKKEAWKTFINPSPSASFLRPQELPLPFSLAIQHAATPPDSFPRLWRRHPSNSSIRPTNLSCKRRSMLRPKPLPRSLLLDQQPGLLLCSRHLHGRNNNPASRPVVPLSPPGNSGQPGPGPLPSPPMSSGVVVPIPPPVPAPTRSNPNPGGRVRSTNTRGRHSRYWYLRSQLCEYCWAGWVKGISR